MQHALTYRTNVVIDINASSRNGATKQDAANLAQKIAAKVPQ
jgi:hypothetical protein